LYQLDLIHTLSIEVSTKVSSISQNQTRDFTRALEMLTQAIGGFARGGPGGNNRNGGGAHSLKGPCSYQDFLKTHPPMFTPIVEPLDVEHWLRILEQKF
jgi:hypothetical protein